jgi:hypothetical protein
MLEFKVIENLKPNKDLIDILKDFKYKVKLGQIKTIIHTNLKVIIPTEYQITYPTTLIIIEYKVNEISNKPFYIKEHNQKYNIKEIAYFLKNF